MNRNLAETENYIKKLIGERSNRETAAKFKELLNELRKYNIVGFNMQYFINYCVVNDTMSQRKKINDLLNRCCEKRHTWQGIIYCV